MTLNFFKKNTVVGVSVTPEAGLEVAQIDFESKTVLKYSRRNIEFDNARKEIADLDVFRDTLGDLLFELDIPKGSEIVLNIPSIVFGVKDFPASLTQEEIQSAIEEDLLNVPIFQNSESAMDFVTLPNSTIQFNKTAYIASHKTMLIEIAIQIKELGYKLITIDSSVNSILNALIYNERVDISPNKSWVLLLVENSSCKIISMSGRNYVDAFNEQISIGEVLGDDDNYSTVVEAVSPILKNLPAQYLYVVSKTNIISAQKLANILNYNAPIIHLEANKYATSPYLETTPDIVDDSVITMSLDVVGAAVRREFEDLSNSNFNLFNESFGDVYLQEQPPVIVVNGKKLVLSMQNMCIASTFLAAIVIALTVIIYIPIVTSIHSTRETISKIEEDIVNIQQFLDEHKNISTELFDEGDEIKMGLAHNKNIYTYYTIVGTEIPQKLWLTALNLSDAVTIDGQADNLESIYGFFRNIKDYNPNSKIKLQKLGYATKSKMKVLTEEEAYNTNSIVTAMNADFYEFRISNAPEEVKVVTNKKVSEEEGEEVNLPELEEIEE